MSSAENITVVDKSGSRATAWLFLSAFIVMADQLSKECRAGTRPRIRR